MHAYACIRMYVYPYVVVCVYARLQAQLTICVRIYMHGFCFAHVASYAYVCTTIYECECTCVCMYVCVYVCMSVCVYVWVDVCMYME